MITISVRWDHEDDEIQAKAIGVAIPNLLPVGLTIPVPPTVEVVEWKPTMLTMTWDGKTEVRHFANRDQLIGWLRADWHQIMRGDDPNAPERDDEFVAYLREHHVEFEIMEHRS